MTMIVETKTFSLPPVNKAEVLRYSGCKAETEDLSELLETSVSLISEKISPSVCYCELSFSADGNICTLGEFSFTSADLAAHLSGFSKAVVFAATIGIEADRLIIRYGRLVPSRGVMLSAVADERIEALCDVFCAEKKAKSPRFSPGYGDLPLEIQKNIFEILNCPKNIGLTLNGSLLMSPTKSVTAIFGIE
ncbi:MAG: Vitamin B12 dependent methionine synthase activation subunit [Oscillospiraceae bacterium]|nr:Vitamin B12 dependent methionine synthase activation subunit [Oscillospiraceae bacterium]